MAFIEHKQGTLYFPIPIYQLFSTRYDDIHHYWLLFKRFKNTPSPQKTYI